MSCITGSPSCTCRPASIPDLEVPSKEELKPLLLHVQKQVLDILFGLGRGSASRAAPCTRRSSTHGTVRHRSGPAASSLATLAVQASASIAPASAATTSYSGRAVLPVVTSAEWLKEAGYEGMPKRDLEQLTKKKWLEMGKRLKVTACRYWLVLCFCHVQACCIKTLLCPNRVSVPCSAIQAQTGALCGNIRVFLSVKAPRRYTG